LSASTDYFGITRYGAYVPRLRMQRGAIAAAHQWMAPDLVAQARGQRAFCSWDEDSVTMGVEAARDASIDSNQPVKSILLATTRPPFADLSGAGVIAGALNLPHDIRTHDLGNSQRAAVGALMAMLEAGSNHAVLVASDHPAAKPASTQELSYGAGAAAFGVGDSDIIAQYLGGASFTSSFVDHFRAVEAKYDYFWEERWIRDAGLAKIIPETVAAALNTSNVKAADVSRFIFGSPLKDASSMIVKKCGMAADVVADSLDQCGYAGSAHSCLMLARELERARPGEILVVVGFGQGCDVIVLRATEALRDFAPRRGVTGCLADAQPHNAYLRMLAYDKAIDLEWGMRAEKQLKTSLTEQHRSAFQIASFTAGKCSRCGTIQFPQLAYCVNPGCAAPQKSFVPLSLPDQGAQVLTYTADWLSFYPAPPLYVGFVQFDNGARLLMEIVDVGAAGLQIGTRLKIVHRIKDVDETRGYPRYFWKATPLAA
jgi:3-hydroxy-3-methylglutaryl CoA synthase